MDEDFDVQTRYHKGGDDRGGSPRSPGDHFAGRVCETSEFVSDFGKGAPRGPKCWLMNGRPAAEQLAESETRGRSGGRVFRRAGDWRTQRSMRSMRSGSYTNEESSWSDTSDGERRKEPGAVQRRRHPASTKLGSGGSAFRSRPPLLASHPSPSNMPAIAPITGMLRKHVGPPPPASPSHPKANPPATRSQLLTHLAAGSVAGVIGGYAFW